MDPAHERNGVTKNLGAALITLERSMSIRLIPTEGASFGYAIRGARDNSGVAAVKGGILVTGACPRRSGPCLFGTDEPVIRAILTAMKFDSSVRSACLLQYSDRALTVLKDDLFLECAVSAAVAREGGICTMDWGIASVCKNGVPDVIYEKNTGVNRSRITIFGEDPADVTNNIIICSNRI
jgi:thiamine-phosphate diphosphorylase